MYRCPCCGRQFSRLFSVKLHFRAAHYHVRDCPACGARFSSRLELMSHLRRSEDVAHQAVYYLAASARYRRGLLRLGPLAAEGLRSAGTPGGS